MKLAISTKDFCFRWRCDRERDCEDGSDEDGCDYQSDSDTDTSEAAEAGARLSCDGQNLLSCGASDQCVHRDWVCDGDRKG